MALTAYIEPVTVVENTATELSTYVINYDLQGQHCTTYWWLSTNSGSKLYDGNWDVPQDVLEVWGQSDKIIIEALAQAKGFVITGYPTGSVQSLDR
jgi:hypothetical protein